MSLNKNVSAQKKPKRNRFFKRILLILVLIIAIPLALIRGLELWIQANFEDKLNANPDREYNITFSKVDLHAFFHDLTLEEVEIKPLNIKEKHTIIKGNVAYATIQGILWKDLLFGKRLSINNIAFKQPKFEIILSNDKKKKTNAKEVQIMFSDILTRANINNFKIENGSIVLKDPISKTIKSQVKQVNLMANGINTDSIKFAHLIPFEMRDMHVSMRNISFNVDNITRINLDHFDYNLKKEEILLKNFSLGYTVNWVEASRQLGYQTEIIDFTIKEIGLHKFKTSKRFYSHLDVVAKELAIDGLDIRLRRNKNIPRPPDVEKPTFQGVANAVPINYSIDNIQVSNSSVTYGELPLHKSETGLITFNNVNGNFSGTTNIPDKQKKLENIDVKINAKLYGKANVNLAINIPYKNNSFTLNVDVGEMEMYNFNTTLIPLSGVEMISGDIKRIKYFMNAGEFHAQNRLIFDYDNLHLKVMDQKHRGKRKGLMSILVDGAIRKKNLPSQKKHVIATYQSDRNIYRSSINYMIKSLLGGLPKIIPRKLTQKLMLKDKKKKKKKKKKN